MKARSTLLNIAIASIIASSPALLTNQAFAEDVKAPQEATTEASASASTEKASTTDASATDTSADEVNFIKTVDDAYKAIREIRASRVAIFNGTPEQATQLTADAQKNLELSEELIQEHAIETQKKAQEDDAYIPFDVTMSLSEGFVPSDEKNAVLETANEHLSNGDKAKAVSALKLANIDVSVTTVLLPAASSLQHVKDAAKLLSEKKYYEANLALKAVEDSVIVESYDINSIPVQAKQQ